MVREFLQAVRRDGIDAEQLERLVAVDALALAMGIDPAAGGSAAQRHAQIRAALIEALRGDAPTRHLMLQGSIVIFGERVHGDRVVVELGQILPNQEVVKQGIELERVDGLWKIRGFLDPRP